MSQAADGHTRLKTLVVLGLAAVVALKLFAFGIAYPLGLRLRGDAYQYLTITSSFDSLAAALAYAGERTGGFPLFEFTILRLLQLFSPQVHVLAWADTLGVALLAIHFATAWVFATWARRCGIVHSRNTALLLFFFLATFPALVGHTTTPLTDTLAMDLVLCAVASLGAALGAAPAGPGGPGSPDDRGAPAAPVSSRLKPILLALLAAFFLGSAILVRPGNLFPLAGALLAAGAVALLAGRRAAVLLGIAVAGCLLVLAPYSARCTQKYGSLCLQSPKAFDAPLIAQVGLRGARTLWNKSSGAPAEIPTLPDATLVTNYASRCRLASIIGTTDTSLTGCLLSRPLVLPVYVAKKWIGLFDHFRFTPYLEDDTPPWLRGLSRSYSALAWTGFALCFVALFQAARRASRPGIRPWATGNLPLVLLVAYSALMLAQHTVFHIEDRYSFPMLPLCAIVLLVFGERAVQKYRTAGWRSLWPLALYCALAVGLFVAQIVAWDHTAFY